MPAELASSAHAWRPLLSGEEAAAARNAVVDIARALEDRAINAELDGGIAVGRAGTALLFAYCAREGLMDSFDPARRDLREAVAKAGGRVNASLYTGVTGVVWAIAHTAGTERADRSARHVDRMLLERLQPPGWPHDFDLIRGLVGIGAYALERLPGEAGQAMLEAVLQSLADSARPVNGGLAWPTPPGRPGSPPEPQVEYNLGMAHGTPGVVAFLAAAHASGAGTEDIAAMLDPAVEWLIAQAAEPDADSRFAYRVIAGQPVVPARSAWCYGDPGVAVAILAAARARDRPDWEGEALATALAAARRPAERTEIGDPGLCHGSAGVAHCFARLHAATGRPELAEAARRWYLHTLELRRPADRAAGFFSMEPDEAGQLRPKADPSFLLGAAGVGLALLAATSQANPEWDRLLLLSHRGAQPARTAGRSDFRRRASSDA